MQRRSALTALLLCAVLVLTACSNPVPKSQTKSEPKGEFTTIRIAYPKQYGFWVDPLIQGFQKAHKEYRMDPVQLETDYANVVRDALAGGKADVAVINALPFSMVSNVTDLEPYIRKSNLDMGGYKLEQSQYQISGRIYALPLLAYPRALFGNPELFKKAGVPIPAESWTWDEFRVAAQKLTNKDANVYGIDSNATEMLTQLRLMQYDVGTPAWLAGEKAWKETLQFWSTVMLTDKSSRPLARSKEGPLNRQADQTELLNGQAAMGLWVLGGQLPEEFVALPMPTIPNAKPVTYAWFFSGTIPNNSLQPDGAWEFLRWAAGPEGSLELAKNGILPMYLNPEIEETWLKKQPKGAQTILHSRWMSHWSEGNLRNIMDDAINRALTGTDPWEKVAADYLTASASARVKP